MEIYKNLNLQDLGGETWKVITDFPDYFVSNYGRVKSLKFKKERIIKPYKRSKYFSVDLCMNGKKNIKQLHILVFETHSNYKLNDSECVHHLDENKYNNCYSNLKKMLDKYHKIFHHIGKHHSNKTKRKMSEIRKEKFKNGELFISEKLKNILKNQDQKGEKNNNSVLINKKVIQIKMLFKLGFKNNEIYKLYNVESHTISDIRTEKTWKHIVV